MTSPGIPGSSLGRRRFVCAPGCIDPYSSGYCQYVKEASTSTYSPRSSSRVACWTGIPLGGRHGWRRDSPPGAATSPVTMYSAPSRTASESSQWNGSPLQIHASANGSRSWTVTGITSLASENNVQATSSARRSFSGTGDQTVPTRKESVCVGFRNGIVSGTDAACEAASADSVVPRPPIDDCSLRHGRQCHLGALCNRVRGRSSLLANQVEPGHAPDGPHEEGHHGEHE